MTYENSLMFEIAFLYYNHNLTQESISRKLNISKYKVNRVLKEAKKQGIVQINVINPEYINMKLKR